MYNRIETRKGAILYSTKNEASLNIIDKLKRYFYWREEQKDKLYFSPCLKSDCCTKFYAYGQEKEILQVRPTKSMKEDYFLYASTHKSEKSLKSLTVHIPGNFSEAKFGGEPKTLNYSFASKLKQILKLLDEENKKNSLGWNVTMEVDHHGPTIKEKKPLIFVEIGSSKDEWQEPVAGKIVASVLFNALLLKAEEYKTYIAFGGGHYAPKFNDYQLGKKKLNQEEIAISHICSKYDIEQLDKELVFEAIEKNLEKIEGALIDKKGLNNKQQERLIKILKEVELNYFFV
ncbi:MAG: D-aminoacyl-tRNA deacylase [Candidatus Omnitrophica bacterium]|nr:D-aminoacyl-tRNA deacylase [Candidatus Omnitrophota bacterium]